MLNNKQIEKTVSTRHDLLLPLKVPHLNILHIAMTKDHTEMSAMLFSAKKWSPLEP